MKKILVTGAGGLVGSAIKRLYDVGTWGTEYQISFVGREFDLRVIDTSDYIVRQFKPDVIINTAANVGGLLANMSHPVECFTDNIRINTNIIESAAKAGVKRLIAFSSVCAYPNHLELLEEEKMHDGPPHEAHFGYAHAKRMVDVLIQSCRRQYGSDYCTLTPVNIYGPNDYYDLTNGHIIPSLTYKCFEAVKNNKPFVVWGDGTPQREFLYVDDVVKIVVALLDLPTLPERLILTHGIETPIADIATKIAAEFGYSSPILYDKTKPNGQLRRPSNPNKLKGLLPFILPKFEWTTVAEGLAMTCDWFKANYPNVRK